MIVRSAGTASRPVPPRAPVVGEFDCVLEFAHIRTSISNIEVPRASILAAHCCRDRSHVIRMRFVRVVYGRSQSRRSPDERHVQGDDQRRRVEPDWNGGCLASRRRPDDGRDVDQLRHVDRRAERERARLLHPQRFGSQRFARRGFVDGAERMGHRGTTEEPGPSSSPR